jgi:hypothetical protein
VLELDLQAGNDVLQTTAASAVADRRTTLETFSVKGGSGRDRIQLEPLRNHEGRAVSFVVDAGSGVDELQITTGPFSADIDSVHYTPGPSATEGHLRYFDEDEQIITTIDFDNLQAVADLVPAASLLANGTASRNAIFYGEGPHSGSAAAPFSDAVSGLVATDDLTPIEFANKNGLTINAGAGSDEVMLVHIDRPQGLAKITVNGDGPLPGSAAVGGVTQADGDRRPTSCGNGDRGDDRSGGIRRSGGNAGPESAW